MLAHQEALGLHPSFRQRNCIQTPQVTSNLSTRSPCAIQRLKHEGHLGSSGHKPDSLWNSRNHTYQQRGCRTNALIDTEVSQADSWSIDARAAMLDLTWDKLTASLADVPQLATCDPACLFALKESARLLSIEVPEMLQLVQRVPTLLDTPTITVQQSIQVLQTFLQIPQRAAIAILLSDPAMLPLGGKKTEYQLQRLYTALGMLQAEHRALLGWLLQAGLPDTPLSDPQPLVQQVRQFARFLHTSVPDAIAVMQAESIVFGDLQQLLDASDLLETEWQKFSDEIDIPRHDLMSMIVHHLQSSEPRYSLRSLPSLQASLSALSAATCLSRRALVEMLLSAPDLTSVPGSFWDLLLQYLLFLVPDWRKQLDAMPASEAGRLIVDLFHGSESSDMVQITPADLQWLTADHDYSRELEVLAALLDSGLAAPELEPPDHIRAGKVWRLIYLCNPRLIPTQQLLTTAAEAATSSNSGSGRSSPWSWVPLKLLPPPLMLQRQERAMLSCDLHTAEDYNSTLQGLPQCDSEPSMQAANDSAEVVEGLWEAVSLDTDSFCARHPGYAHWLYGAAFELEWSNHAAAVPLTTWDC